MLELTQIVSVAAAALAAVAFLPALHTKLTTAFKTDGNGRFIALTVAAYLTAPVTLFATYSLASEYDLIAALMAMPIIWLSLVAGLILNTTIVYEEGKTAARKKDELTAEDIAFIETVK